VVDRIGKLGNPLNQRSTQKVEVLRMTVTP
jgi:hypothetical protein